MVVPIPLGQCIEVVAYGVVAFHPSVATHYGAHQIGLGESDARVLHLHQQFTAECLVEHLPHGSVTPSLA